MKKKFTKLYIKKKKKKKKEIHQTLRVQPPFSFSYTYIIYPLSFKNLTFLYIFLSLLFFTLLIYY